MGGKRTSWQTIKTSATGVIDWIMQLHRGYCWI